MRRLTVTIANVTISLMENSAKLKVRKTSSAYFSTSDQFWNLSGRPVVPQRDRAATPVAVPPRQPNKSKKCRKQKFRDYFIEPNNCR